MAHAKFPWSYRLNKNKTTFIIENEDMKKHPRAMICSTSWWTSGDTICPDMEESESNVAFIVKAANCHNGLVEALDKLLALYRKETGLHYGLDNPVTTECREILVEARRVP